MHEETTPPDALAEPCCLDCGDRATHGLVLNKQGIYHGTRVPHGARWCQTHGIAAAKRRNASPSAAAPA
jgi:hypothetical protein